MFDERDAESSYLGRFIPAQYHHDMLMDEERMAGFKSAIEHTVFDGARVLELGGGTGVMSWFAAQKASKVWCVEYNPDLVEESRAFLAQNPNGDRVEVIHADAFDYLPPEPVDVVICEMVHVAMLRQKQVQMIESFKRRYLARFGGRLPRFIPEAAIMAVQPLQQAYSFHGFKAPLVQFQQCSAPCPGTIELGAPAVYKVLDFTEPNDSRIAWQGRIHMRRAGHFNALRFMTKNVLAVLMAQGTTIDWQSNFMVLPLGRPIEVEAGDAIDLRFEYRAGNSIPSLQHAIHAEVVVRPVELECAA
jgi:predicted RNA methylase